MKKKLLLVLVFLISVSLVWMTLSSIYSFREEEQKELKQSSLSSIFSSLGVNTSLPEKKTILIYFNSECDQCHWEVAQISSSLAEFGDVNLFFISSEKTQNAYSFLEEYGMSQYYLNADSGNVTSTFKGVVPQIFIYEGDELQKKFEGVAKVEALIKVIR